MAGSGRAPYCPRMVRFGREAAPDGRPDRRREANPAVRDAAAILARATVDDAAADEARERYRTQRMAALEPDARIAPLLAVNERVLAMRPGAIFDLCRSTLGPDAPHGVAGDLYVTSRRLVLVGRVSLSFDLRDIEETGLSGERLLLVMRDGSSVSVQTGQPRLLRVEIGTARARARV
jgi:hypothetical protein